MSLSQRAVTEALGMTPEDERCSKHETLTLSFQEERQLPIPAIEHGFLGRWKVLLTYVRCLTRDLYRYLRMDEWFNLPRRP